MFVLTSSLLVEVCIHKVLCSSLICCVLACPYMQYSYSNGYVLCSIDELPLPEHYMYAQGVFGVLAKTQFLNQSRAFLAKRRGKNPGTLYKKYEALQFFSYFSPAVALSEDSLGRNTSLGGGNPHGN